MPEIIRPISWSKSQLYWLYVLAGFVVWCTLLIPLLGIAGGVGLVPMLVATLVTAIPTPLLVKRRMCFHQLIPLIVSTPIALVTAFALHPLAALVSYVGVLLVSSAVVRVTTPEYHYGGNSCPSCGYDVPQMNDRCSECGRAIEWK